jgi:predicted PurR-regulated permease PerM
MGPNDDHYSYPQKVWTAAGIVALVVVVVLLLKATFNVLLLVLAGVLIAVFFKGLSGLIQRKTKWKEGLCTTIAVVVTLLILVLLFWLMGAKIQSQAAQLSETLPTTIENAKAKLNESPLGQKLVERLSSKDAGNKGEALLRGLFTSTFGVLGDMYVVLFLGIFFTVSPKLYKEGMVKLVPKKGRAEAKTLLDKLDENLKKWIKGKLLAMLIVFVLTAIGLAVIGVPLWLILALIAGLLSFIPNFGPLIALVLAALIGLLQGPTTALWIIGLYLLVQLLESNVITPMVQQKLISVPPGLLLTAQLLMAVLTGGWGLALATPLLVILMVVVQELYIKKQEAA